MSGRTTGRRGHSRHSRARRRSQAGTASTALARHGSHPLGDGRVSAVKVGGAARGQSRGGDLRGGGKAAARSGWHKGGGTACGVGAAPADWPSRGKAPSGGDARGAGGRGVPIRQRACRAASGGTPRRRRRPRRRPACGRRDGGRACGGGWSYVGQPTATRQQQRMWGRRRQPRRMPSPNRLPPPPPSGVITGIRGCREPIAAAPAGEGHGRYGRHRVSAAEPRSAVVVRPGDAAAAWRLASC